MCFICVTNVICISNLVLSLQSEPNDKSDLKKNNENKLECDDNIMNAATIPSNIDENCNRISDDESICNTQMSSDNTNDLNAENYQMADEVDIETDSDTSNVLMPYENLGADDNDENYHLQNIFNIDDDDENNHPNNALEQVCFKSNIFCL